MFKKLEGDTVVLQKGGVFKVCDLYAYRGYLFANYAGGYIRLTADGHASVPGVSVDMLAYEGPLYKDRFGRLAVSAGEGYTALQSNPDGTITPLKIEGPK